MCSLQEDARYLGGQACFQAWGQSRPELRFSGEKQIGNMSVSVLLMLASVIDGRKAGQCPG